MPANSPWLAFAKMLKAELGIPIGLAMSLALWRIPLSKWDPYEDEHPLHDVLENVLDQTTEQRLRRNFVVPRGKRHRKPGP